MEQRLHDPDSNGPRKAEYVYDEFPDTNTVSGLAIAEDLPRRAFRSTVHQCKELCDRDQLCDCIMYTPLSQRCDKRRACDSTPASLQEAPGTNLYLQVPKGVRLHDYEHIPSTNIFNTNGVAWGDGQVLENATVNSCKRSCDLHPDCHCFVYSTDRNFCTKFLQCVESTRIPDQMYSVFLKVDREPEAPEPFNWVAFVRDMCLILLLIVLLLLIAYCIWRCCRQARTVRTEPYKHEPLNRYTPSLGAGLVVKDAAKVERWPGRCAACGCNCGQPPSWVGSSAFVVEKAPSGHQMSPGDIIVEIGNNLLKTREDLDTVLEAYDPGTKLELLVLRPRKLAAPQGSLARPCTSPAELLKAAEKSHEKVRLSVVLGKS